MENPVPILLLEDSEIDVEIVKRILKKAKIENPLFVAEDGVQALEILNSHNDSQKPFLILVDINMPRMDGFTFLETIRNNESLNKNVAFMLTTSSREEDMERAYSLNAAGYVVKDDINQLGDMLSEYLDISRFPDYRHSTQQ